MADLSGILSNLGGGALDNLLNQFNQGQHDQVPDEQVQQAYDQVATQLPQDQYVQAAQEAFDRLTPEQREEFARQLQAKAQQQGVNVNVPAQGTTDAGSLANAVGQVHAEQPNLLQQMFAPGGVFSNPAAKAALLGITAMAAQRLMSSRR
jgi:hypothetical protein